MTQKSRRRKVEKKVLHLKTYVFATNTRDIQIKAHSDNEARTLFQEKFGYWPTGK